MRIGTFVLGSIAGAAAAIYLNRKAKNMMFSAFSSKSDAAGVGKIMDKAKDAFTNTGNKTNDASMSANAGNKNNASTNGLDQVENIVKQDPSLKHAVNEILLDNKENTAAIQ